MSFFESLRKNSEFTKEVDKITEIQSVKSTLVYILLFGFYWAIAVWLNEKYNYYLHMNSKMYFLPVNYNRSRLVLIIALIGALIWFILSVKLRVTSLVLAAQLLILITYFWIIIKSIAYGLYKLFALLFKVEKKISKKYNNLNEREKAILKTATVFLVGLAARQFIKAGLSEENSTFVNPHEVSGYTRADGIKVDGYWRDGDGNPFTNLKKEQGGGYFRNK